MIDPGAIQNVIKQLNRWYRKKAKPRGTMDYYHRGIRMSYTAAYRGMASVAAGILFLTAAVLYFEHGFMDKQPPLLTMLLKLSWVAIIALAFVTLLQAFRACVVITDDGLIKYNLLGREKRMTWDKISTYRIKSDDNKVIFLNKSKAKLTVSLSFDGWQDFREMAVRRMTPDLYWQLNLAIATIDVKRPNVASIKLPAWLRRSSRKKPS